MKTMNRIMIFGRPGSGKSTFAVELGKKLNIPVYHLDRYFFTANWQERDHNAFLQDLHHMVQEPKWIIDGQSIKSLEIRYARADIALYFDYPRWLCYWRIFKRAWFEKISHMHGRVEKCPEIIRWKLLKYMWTLSKRLEEPIAVLRAKYPQVKFYRIRNDRELKNFFSILTK